MRPATKIPQFDRRQALKLTAAAAGGLVLPAPAAAQTCMAKQGTVRDRFWLFAGTANRLYRYVQRRSLMTPAEGAYYLSIPNVLIIQSGDGILPRFEPPFEQYAIGLRPLKRVAWSIVGSGGQTSSAETKEVLDLAQRVPNWVGIYLDDFFFDPNRKGKRAALSVDELRDVRQQLHTSSKKLDIFATYYTRLLDLPLNDYLELIDVLALWTWLPSDLANLPANLDKLNQVAPHKRVMLGCYFYNFHDRTPLTVADMKLQCEAGLRWLQEGRIEGMIFLTNTLADFEFESVEWTRKWIQEVGDTMVKTV